MTITIVQYWIYLKEKVKKPTTNIDFNIVRKFTQSKTRRMKLILNVLLTHQLDLFSFSVISLYA